MADTQSYIRHLTETDPLRQPLLQEVIRALHLAPGSRGLDAGCGIGLQTELLADAVGRAGRVTGIDHQPELLHHAGTENLRAGRADRITLSAGDIGTLPFGDASFDWVWSADCIGYPAGELVPLLQEVARVVRPGGTVAILAWSSQCLLPGHSLLEARLNAHSSALAPYLRGQPPEAHFARALGRFAEAGLVRSAAATFVRDVQAPLSDAIRVALVSLFEMLWGEPRPNETAADRTAYQRLCRPESPEFILDSPDYYGFFTYTLFRATVPV